MSRTSATFSSYKILYVPSDSGNTGGGITDADNALLTARKAEIGSFVGAGGGLMMLTQQGLALPYSSVELPLPFTVSSSFTGPGGSGTLFQTAALAAAGFSISDAELSVGTPVHNAFTGPSGFNGLQVLITNGSGGTGDVITLGGGATTVFVPVMPPVALWAMAALLLLIGVTLVRRRQTA